MTTKKLTVYAATASSESGDDYGPYLFAKKPTEAALKKFWKAECPDEFPDDPDEAGPGDWGSYLYTKIEACTVLP